MTFSTIYGHKWNSLYQDENAVKVALSVWSRALAGLSDYQLEQGVQRCFRREGWPPSTGEFLRLATGLPGRAEAIARVVSRNVIDPVTRNILTAIGSWELKRLETDRLSKRAAAYYDDALESALNEVIGLPGEWQAPAKIEAPDAQEEGQRADPSVAKSHLQAIQNKLNRAIKI